MPSSRRFDCDGDGGDGGQTVLTDVSVARAEQVRTSGRGWRTEKSTFVVVRVAMVVTVMEARRSGQKKSYVLELVLAEAVVARSSQIAFQQSQVNEAVDTVCCGGSCRATSDMTTTCGECGHTRPRRGLAFAVPPTHRPRVVRVRLERSRPTKRHWVRSDVGHPHHHLLPLVVAYTAGARMCRVDLYFIP